MFEAMEALGIEQGTDQLPEAGGTFSPGPHFTPHVTPLDGLRFVLTGRFADMTRPQAEAQLKSLGAAIGSSVSKNTTALFAGEAAGSKRAKAESLGLPIFDEDRLQEALQDPAAFLERLTEEEPAGAI